MPARSTYEAGGLISLSTVSDLLPLQQAQHPLEVALVDDPFVVWRRLHIFPIELLSKGTAEPKRSTHLPNSHSSRAVATKRRPRL